MVSQDFSVVFQVMMILMNICHMNINHLKKLITQLTIKFLVLKKMPQNNKLDLLIEKHVSKENISIQIEVVMLKNLVN